MKYQLIRTCKDCKNEDVFELTKIQSAFELYDSNEIRNKKCTKCNSVNCLFIQHPYVRLDKEVLDVWGKNEKLFLNPQDEELILAEMHYLPMILISIEEGKYLKHKIGILLESICILLYDNTVTSNGFSEKEMREKEKNTKIILPELIKLKGKILDSEKYIMEYVKIVVYPQIGIE